MKPAMPTFIRGDARQLPLPDESVDLVVCSPPYFGLRDYGYTGQIGSEPTPAEFLAALLDVTAECVRVLKPSGSLFVNLGDKYAGSRMDGSNDNGTGATRLGGGTSVRDRHAARGQGRVASTGGIPTKSLMLIPERYRIACVDQLGLICRAVLIWSKPNGLPESVTDRVRRSHEDWVHLVKQPRYYSAVDEIREQHAPGTAARYRIGYSPESTNAGEHRPSVNVDYGTTFDVNPLGKLPGSVWTIPTQPLTVPPELGVDHFAAFPMEWPRRLILGWSPREVCSACSEGRRPVTEGTPMEWRPSPTQSGRVAPGASRATASGTMLAPASRTITGYVCACPDTTAPATPGTVLDPFSGTGTAPLVATMLGRRGVGVELSADYIRLAQWRASDPKERARAAGLDPDAVSVIRRQLPGQESLFEQDGGAA